MLKFSALLRFLALSCAALLFSTAQAQPAPYGVPITLEAASKVAAAATAEARKNNWPVVISIVDSAGQLVLLHRLDNTQYASLDIATGKAKTSVNFRRPTKALEDAIAGGGAGLRLLRVDGLTPLEGGIPIIVDGKIVGGIGVSGVTSQQDAQIAKAGIDALTK
ncbi:MAG: GlcG/HbpS family heme-binding protein [Burkholderiaceae bacterium]